MSEIIQDGFQYPERIDEKDYILGAERSAPFEVINKEGNWKSWLPEQEKQRKRIETNGCTNYGSLNLVEILMSYKYDKQENYSERFQAVMSDQSRNGNNPHDVLESIRKDGVLEDEVLPFTEDITTFDDYKSPDPMPKELRIEALKFLNTYSVRHEYIYDPYNSRIPIQEKQRLLMQALMRSPVGVSVYAWREKDGLYYKPEGARDTHWCVLIGSVPGSHWIVFDSYEPYIKKLEWDFRFDVSKGIWMGKAQSKSWITQLWMSIINLFSNI